MLKSSSSKEEFQNISIPDRSKLKSPRRHRTSSRHSKNQIFHQSEDSNSDPEQNDTNNKNGESSFRKKSNIKHSDSIDNYNDKAKTIAIRTSQKTAKNSSNGISHIPKHKRKTASTRIVDSNPADDDEESISNDIMKSNDQLVVHFEEPENPQKNRIKRQRHHKRSESTRIPHKKSEISNTLSKIPVRKNSIIDEDNEIPEKIASKSKSMRKTRHKKRKSYKNSESDSSRTSKRSSSNASFANTTFQLNESPEKRTNINLSRTSSVDNSKSKKRRSKIPQIRPSPKNSSKTLHHEDNEQIEKTGKYQISDKQDLLENKTSYEQDPFVFNAYKDEANGNFNDNQSNFKLNEKQQINYNPYEPDSDQHSSTQPNSEQDSNQISNKEKFNQNMNEQINHKDELHHNSNEKNDSKSQLNQKSNEKSNLIRNSNELQNPKASRIPTTDMVDINQPQKPPSVLESTSAAARQIIIPNQRIKPSLVSPIQTSSYNYHYQQQNKYLPPIEEKNEPIEPLKIQPPNNGQKFEPTSPRSINKQQINKIICPPENNKNYLASPRKLTTPKEINQADNNQIQQQILQPQLPSTSQHFQRMKMTSVQAHSKPQSRRKKRRSRNSNQFDEVNQFADGQTTLENNSNNQPPNSELNQEINHKQINSNSDQHINELNPKTLPETNNQLHSDKKLIENKAQLNNESNNNELNSNTLNQINQNGMNSSQSNAIDQNELNSNKLIDNNSNHGLNNNVQDKNDDLDSNINLQKEKSQTTVFNADTQLTPNQQQKIFSSSLPIPINEQKHHKHHHHSHDDKLSTSTNSLSGSSEHKHRHRHRRRKLKNELDSKSSSQKVSILESPDKFNEINNSKSAPLIKFEQETNENNQFLFTPPPKEKVNRSQLNNESKEINDEKFLFTPPTKENAKKGQFSDEKITSEQLKPKKMHHDHIHGESNAKQVQNCQIPNEKVENDQMSNEKVDSNHLNDHLENNEVDVPLKTSTKLVISSFESPTIGKSENQIDKKKQIILKSEITLAFSSSANPSPSNTLNSNELTKTHSYELLLDDQHEINHQTSLYSNPQISNSAPQLSQNIDDETDSNSNLVDKQLEEEIANEVLSPTHCLSKTSQNVSNNNLLDNQTTNLYSKSQYISNNNLIDNETYDSNQLNGQIYDENQLNDQIDNENDQNYDGNDQIDNEGNDQKNVVNDFSNSQPIQDSIQSVSDTITSNTVKIQASEQPESKRMSVKFILPPNINFQPKWRTIKAHSEPDEVLVPTNIPDDNSLAQTFQEPTDFTKACKLPLSYLTSTIDSNFQDYSKSDDVENEFKSDNIEEEEEDFNEPTDFSKAYRFPLKYLTTQVEGNEEEENFDKSLSTSITEVLNENEQELIEADEKIGSNFTIIRLYLKNKDIFEEVHEMLEDNVGEHFVLAISPFHMNVESIYILNKETFTMRKVWGTKGPIIVGEADVGAFYKISRETKKMLPLTNIVKLSVNVDAVAF